MKYVNSRDYMNAFAKKDKTLYSNVIYASFPRKSDLPIVGQDFTYTMDITYMTIRIQKMIEQTYRNRKYRIDVRPFYNIKRLIDSMRETIT